MSKTSFPGRYWGRVGKSMVGKVYVHKLYATLIFPEQDLDLAKSLLPENFTFDLISTDRGSRYSFIQCPGFDSQPEPIRGLAYLVNIKDKTIRKITPPSDPWIYHHKWLMVMDDYPGFDVAESKERSRQWMQFTVDYRKIGKLSCWLEFLDTLGNLLENSRRKGQ